MDRRSHLVNLTFRLKAASSGLDWTVLGRIDRDLPAVLPRLAALGPWNDSERLALQGLRQAHRHALEHCERESASIGRLLNEMCANKEGWMAYTLVSDDEQEKPA